VLLNAPFDVMAIIVVANHPFAGLP